jgi:hypothetical protein
VKRDASGEPHWVQLREYAGRFEADLDIGLLEEAGIPVVVKGPATGIYGPGFAGPTAAGVRVFVREVDLVEAIQVLGLPSGEEP